MYLRTRLALSLVCLVAIVIGTFSVFVFQSTRSSVLSEMRRDVRARATGIAEAIEHADVEPSQIDLDVLTTADTYAQVFAPDGTVLASSGNLGARDLPFSSVTVEDGAVIEERVDDLPIYLSRATVRGRDGAQLVVVAGTSPGPMYKVLHRLRRVLGPAALLVLAITAGVVWIVVRRALSRLVRLGTAAEGIAHSKDHTARVGTGGRRDEIGRLAAAIDHMLEALEYAHRDVRDANEAQRTFLADISHELRAPLTVMLSSLEVLQRVGASDPDFQERVLADVHTEASRIARMVSQLLVMARTGTGPSAGDQPVLLEEVVAECCRQWELADHGHRLDWTCDGLEDAVVHANEDYLRQLLHILLDNAFKFTPTDGRIEVCAEQQDGSARVTVIDTGDGIAADEVQRIFERFYRGRNSHGDGSGLGLAIARHIARRYGGDVLVRSEPGRGSNFTLELPIVTG